MFSVLYQPFEYFFLDDQFNAWLSQFAYKANPGIFTFLSAGLVALLVAFVTMSYQSFRAARTNPADSLRNE
jgi:putative ABC transport system permease protein